MTIPTNTPKLLDNPPIPVQAKLAAAWTSFMFLYIYADYFILYKPGFIDDIRSGIVHEFEIGVTFAVIGIALLAIPSVMIVLSMALPPHVNRAVNLVVATLYIPFSVYNASGESSWLPFFALAIGIEVLLLAYILRSAWTWPRTPAVPAGGHEASLSVDVSA
jgi:hypothetical protein